MERKGKGAEREEFFRKKLLLVGKRGGPCTPPPAWRLQFPSRPNNNQKDNLNNSASDPLQEFLVFPPRTAAASVSARKLCANLWEILAPHHHRPLDNLPKGPGVGCGARPRRRRSCHRNGFQVPEQVVEPPCSQPHDQPANASSVRKDVVASPVKHHLSARGNSHDYQSLSPTIYNSSMEVAPCKLAVTPSSSSDRRGKINKSSYTLQTSTELLKVLNHIWSLEEQHASSVSLVKDLKMELNRSQAQIKKLMKQRQRDQQEMNALLKQVVEKKLVGKGREIDRIKFSLQSVREELEDERKLRRHSESLHRKLARELSEMKSSSANALKQLESERRTRILLEKLCDEFAKGIQEYEQTIESLRNHSENLQVGLQSLDPILHVSNAWLHERLQMNLAGARDDSGSMTIIEKLSPQIESFLQARSSVESREGDRFSPNFIKQNHLRQHSLESFMLNETISAPRVTLDEEYTPDSNKKYSDRNGESCAKGSQVGSKQRHESTSIGRLEDMSNSYTVRKIGGSQDTAWGKNLSPLQVHVEKHRAHASSHQENKIQFEDMERKKGEGKNDVIGDISTTYRFYEEMKDTVRERKSKRDKTNQVLGESTATNSLPLEQENKSLDTLGREVSCLQPVFRGHPSPVRPWMSTLTPPHIEKSESLVKCSEGSKADTLKAKLLEARLEGQHPRPKLSRASF